MLSITNTTKRSTPKVPFEKIKDVVLSKRYELSLVFCGNALSRKLNRNYRAKDKATNVLSFKLSGNSGEIFINLEQTIRQPADFSVLYLFIHGLLHLKGMEHGRRMDEAEKKLLEKFSSSKTNGTPNSSWY